MAPHQQVSNHAVTEQLAGGAAEKAEQLEAMKQQYQLKQQEVELLQAQVQRLCDYVDTAVTESVASSGNKAHDIGFSSLLVRLETTTLELLHTKAQLQEALEASQQASSQLAATSAGKAATEHRAWALKMLLAEHVRDNVSLIKALELCEVGLVAAYAKLQEAEHQKAATEALLAVKDDEKAVMLETLSMINTQVVQLTEQTKYLEQMQQPLPQVQLSSKNSSVCQDSAALVAKNVGLKERVTQQQMQLEKQRQDIEQQCDELIAASQQLQSLSRLLAIKEDSLAYAIRHSSLVEHQLESVKQQLAAAQLGKSAAEAPHPLLPASCTAAAGDGQQQAHLQHQEEEQQQFSSHSSCSVNITRSGSTGFLDNLAAAISSKFGSDGRDGSPGPAPSASATAADGVPCASSANASPKVGEQLAVLGPFAKARNLMAQREENALARLKDEVRDKDRQVKKLTSALARAESQLYGLQTVLAAKTGTCNRLEGELRKLERQLKQVQAAADADGDGYKQQLGILSDRVLQLEGQLSVSQQKEQQLQVDWVAMKTKLGEVLAALVEEADCSRKHKPQQHALLKEEMAAVIADIDPIAAHNAAAAQAVIAGSCAAALAVLGPVCHAANGPKETLGNKLLGVLMGRKSSTGLGEIGTPGDRVSIAAGSRDASWSRRISSEWPMLTPTPTARACSEALPPISTEAAVLSTTSGCAGLLPTAILTADADKLTDTNASTSQSAGTTEETDHSPCSYADAGALPCVVPSDCSRGLTLSVADPLHTKLAAVEDMLQKLGHQPADH